MKCSHCKHHKCYTEGQNCTKYSAEEVAGLYEGESYEIMKAAACTEGRYYNEISRLQESAEFAKILGAKKIGVAFCIGLAQEADLIAQYFEQFFAVESVCCKVCGVEKAALGLEQIKEGARETMCDPMMQAKILEEGGAELLFTVGLCVGHDMLFNKAAHKPVSCLVAKDRLLAHNPLGAVYSRYWRRKLGIMQPGQV